jgi:hypothetical protein
MNVVAEVLDRGLRRQRRLHVDDGREGVIVDLHGLGSIYRLCLGLGHDDGDRVAHKALLPGGEWWPLARGMQRDHAGPRCERQIIGGVNRGNSRLCPHLSTWIDTIRP